MSDAPGVTDVVAASAPVTHQRVRRVTLEVLSGPDAGKRVISSADRLTLGTAPGNPLVLTDRAVSRIHCELSRDGASGLHLKDLASTNGTWLEGVRVVEVVLSDQATLKVGASTVRVTVGHDADEAPLYPGAELHGMVGASAVMRALFSQVARLAALDVTVLIDGETGTGKERVAEALHRGGPRGSGPFVVVDCGAIADELVESELFGHVKGAFTGAGDRAGAFEAAKGGTVFLDEVGELPAAVQPKLLRALERRQVKRVGANLHEEVDVRIVAATHKDLKAMVNAGEFREDLYFRLAVAPLRVPPLRERLDDLPLLVDHLWAHARAQMGLPAAPAPPLDAQTLAALRARSWAGNVRELRNFVERSLAFTGELDTAALPEASAAPAGQVRVDLPYGEAKSVWIETFEKAYLAARLKAAQGNVSRLAREANVDRAYVIKLLRRYAVK